MTRRTALVTAGMVTVVLLAAAAVIAVNLGVLGDATATGPVGELSTTDLAHSVTIQQPAEDRQTGPVGEAPADLQDRQPGDDPSGVERGDDHDPGTEQGKPYEGRDDDD